MVKLQEFDGNERKLCKIKPQKVKKDPQMDLFKIEINRIVNTQYSLVKLSHQMDWNAFDQKFEPYFSNEGRPAAAARLMGASQFSGLIIYGLAHIFPIIIKMTPLMPANF